MKVRFARWLSSLFLGIGLALVLFGIWLSVRYDVGTGLSAIIPSLVVFGFGLAYRSMPYFTLTNDRLVVPIMRGPKAITALPPRARIDASGTRLVMTTGKSRIVLPVYRGMAHPDDWAALRNSLTQEQGTEAS
ncbi:hypothetical protein FHX37_2907 [Haloactinospora alba]|uniref:PH (Pleckstrin Homology) domain-containing protein n=1 Tax=Haloactinospora alba TaxID=405555 RepID=A0A543NM71_9ACTN|nr:hypothetical protein [Haloactinospora alba]TQN32919.1 hypothetical protein FHX37_2907 [Haloactinospora alba]